MTFYPPAERRALQAALTSNGVKSDRAAMVVDLACLAAERSVDIAFEVVERAPDSGARMMAIELAVQLAASRMNDIASRVHALGKAAGIRTTQVEIGGAANG